MAIPDDAAITVVPRQRRMGIGEGDAACTFGRTVEYRFKRSHPLAAVIQTLLRHWDDANDPFTLTVKQFFPYRQMMRASPRGQFAGSWERGAKRPLRITPEASDDFSETAPALLAVPMIRPRSPRTRPLVPTDFPATGTTP